MVVPSVTVTRTRPGFINLQLEPGQVERGIARPGFTGEVQVDCGPMSRREQPGSCPNVPKSCLSYRDISTRKQLATGTSSSLSQVGLSGLTRGTELRACLAESAGLGNHETGSRLPSRRPLGGPPQRPGLMSAMVLTARRHSRTSAHRDWQESRYYGPCRGRCEKPAGRTL
jgi:hypothetical protein